MSAIQFSTLYKLSQEGTRADYSLAAVSTAKQNVIKIVCNSPFTGDAVAAYDPSRAGSFPDNYNLIGSSPYIVKQMNNQGKVTALGYLLRYIPGDNQQTFYIEVIEGEFDVRNGVIFNNKTAKNRGACSPDIGRVFGYGSSIREITTLTRVYKLVSAYDTSLEGGQYRYRWLSDDEGYSNVEVVWDYGSFEGGNFVNIKQKSATNKNPSPTDAIVATGKVIAVLLGTGGNTLSIVVDLNQDFSEFSFGEDGSGEYYFEDINATSPCGRYILDVSNKLTAGSTEVQEIVFDDDTTISSSTYVPTVEDASPVNKVFQYNWRSTVEVQGATPYEGINPTYAPAGLIEGSVLGWFAYSKTLYVIVTGSSFSIEYGTLYQRNPSGTLENYLGGNGIISISEKKSGFFFNIAEEYSPATKGEFIPSDTYKIVSNVDSSINRGWYPDQQYTVGSQVLQYKDSDDGTPPITGRVVKWIHPNSFGESLLTPSRLILEFPLVDSNKFNFKLNSGDYEPKIVPSTYNTAAKRATWKYNLGYSVITSSGLVEGTHYTGIGTNSQLLNNDNYREQLLTEGVAFYNKGPRINAYGVALGSCAIRSILPSSAVGPYNVSIFSIQPNSNFNIGDIRKYFNSLTHSTLGATNDLFKVNTDSVELNYIQVDSVIDELETGDIVTTNSGSYATVISLVRDSADQYTKLVVKRDSSTPAFIPRVTVAGATVSGDIIAERRRRGVNYTLRNRLEVISNTPLSNVIIKNENVNGLIYPLQKGLFFSDVKCPVDVYYDKLIYTFFEESTNSVDINEMQFGDLLFNAQSNNHYIIYKTANGIIKKNIGIGNGLTYSNINNIQTITIQKPQDIDASSNNFIFNGNFKGSLNVNYRIKDLETKTNEYRKLIYDDISQTWSCYLSLADIKDLLEIVHETASGSISENLVSYFDLDNGQREDLYGFGRIQLKQGKNKEFFEKLGLVESEYANINNLILKINYTYYLHRRQNNNGVGFPTATASGPVIRESYVYGTSVAEPTGQLIPLNEMGFFRTATNNYHLSSLVDFRPVIKLENGISLNVDQNPYDANTELDHLFTPSSNIYGIQNTTYLPRVDKLYVNKDKQFVVQKGMSSLIPTEPATDSKYGMHLYTINVPSYTINVDDIKFSKVENKRFTMRDIGKLETRINNLEYYTSLSLLEREAADMIIKDSEGNTREKNGIIVDSFIGHSVGNVYNLDYNCAMDFNAGYLRPPFKTTRLDLVKNIVSSGEPTATTPEWTEWTSSNIERTMFIQNVGTGLMMPISGFTSEILVQQPLATQEQLVAPFDVIQYDGKLTLQPPVDDWVDMRRKPTVTVNLDGSKDAWEKMIAVINNNDLAPYGTEWTEWKEVEGSRHVTGRGRTWETTGWWEERIRTEHTARLEEKRINTSLGDKVTDFEILHYTRPQTIDVYCTNFKPNTRFYAFYDNVDVSEFCTIVTSDLNRTGEITQQEIETEQAFSQFANGPRTDNNGNVHIRFYLPEGKFRTGDKLFTVTDNQQNEKYNEDSIMYGSAVFASSGLTVTKQEDIISERVFDIAKDSVEFVERQWHAFTRTWDPLAQTFFVDDIEYPEGVFINSIDLCIGDKDTTAPIRVELRPVVNGFPDSEKIYPNGVSILSPAQVVSVNELGVLPNLDDASTVTTFTFSPPVYLAPGQHALVVRSDVTTYSTFIAQMNKNDLRTGIKVAQNPYQGVFFKSANASTWEPEGNKDLMFRINKLVFTTGVKEQTFTVNTMKDFNNTFEIDKDKLTYELLNASMGYVDFPSCRINFTISINDGSEWDYNIPITPKTDLYLDKAYKLVKRDRPEGFRNGFKLVMQTNVTSPHVVPIVDLNKSGIIFVRNMIDSSEVNTGGSVKPQIINNELSPRAIIKQDTIDGNVPSSVRYLTREIPLSEDFYAKNIRVYLSANLPTGTSVAVFAKVRPNLSKDNFETFEYRQLEYKGLPFVSGDEKDYREMIFELPQDIEDFNRFSIKVCLYTLNTAIVPKIRDLRGIAVL